MLRLVRRVTSKKIYCPYCGKFYPTSEFILIKPGLKWSIVKHQRCKKKFGIFNGDLRSTSRIVNEELREIV